MYSAVTSPIHGFRPTGQLKLFKFIPDEFVNPVEFSPLRLILATVLSVTDAVLTSMVDSFIMIPLKNILKASFCSRKKDNGNKR